MKGVDMARPRKRDLEKMRLADRRSKVLQMTIAGKDTRSIAEEFGVSHTTIAKDIKAALKAAEEGMLTGASELRRIQHLRIIQAIDAVWMMVKGGDLDAISTLIRLSDREAKLLGLDAPQRIDIRKRIEERAREQGWDASEAVAEFERIQREHSFSRN